MKNYFSVHQLLEPAIYYAREGFPVTEVIAAEWQSSMTIKNDTNVTSNGKYPNASNGFWETFSILDSSASNDTTQQRRAPKVGEIFRNPDLANTLSLIGQEGCSAFYNGSIASKIAAFASEGI